MKTFVHFSTVMPDGTLHVTPVWVDYGFEAQRVLVNTARGRRKARNVRRDPAVGVSMTDPNDPYRFVSDQGKLVEVTKEGPVAHVDELAGRYTGTDEYPNKGDEEGPVSSLRSGPTRSRTPERSPPVSRIVTFCPSPGSSHREPSLSRSRLSPAP